MISNVNNDETKIKLYDILIEFLRPYILGEIMSKNDFKNQFFVTEKVCVAFYGKFSFLGFDESEPLIWLIPELKGILKVITEYNKNSDFLLIMVPATNNNKRVYQPEGFYLQLKGRNEVHLLP